MGPNSGTFSPSTHSDSRSGRNPRPTCDALEEVLWILTTNVQWHMLPSCYPNYNTRHCRFQWWCQHKGRLRKEGAIDEQESFIDSTFAAVTGGGDTIALTKRGSGIKILAIMDRHGPLLTVGAHAANHHVITLVLTSTCSRPRPLAIQVYDSNGLNADFKSRRGEGTSLPRIAHPYTQGPGRSASAPLPVPLAHRTVLYMAPVKARPPGRWECRT